MSRRPTLASCCKKNPDRVHTAELPFGVAHVLYPEVGQGRYPAALLVEVDPVGWSATGRAARGNDFSLGQYVNDRPYAAS